MTAQALFASKLDALWSAAGRSVNLIEVHQLAPELPDIADEAVSAVVFVDARAPSASRRSNAPAGPCPKDLPGPGRLAECGHNLDASSFSPTQNTSSKKEPPSWLITVPALTSATGKDSANQPARRCPVLSIS